MPTFNDGKRADSSSACGKPDWLSTTKWRVLHGDGRVSTVPCTKHLWQLNAWGRTPLIGGKNGRKTSLLVDARGIPLSQVASGANVHDVKLLEATLKSIVYPRPEVKGNPIETLCMDAGYVGYDALVITRKQHYVQNLKSRRQESDAKVKTPGHKARRWVVERSHSWFNRYRKLLVSFEKTEASYLGLLHLAAAMICWRQTIAIYG